MAGGRMRTIRMRASKPFEFWLPLLQEEMVMWAVMRNASYQLRKQIDAIENDKPMPDFVPYNGLRIQQRRPRP